MVRFRADLVAEARRADRSLADLLSVGDVVRVSATTAASRRQQGREPQDEVVLRRGGHQQGREPQDEVVLRRGGHQQGREPQDEPVLRRGGHQQGREPQDEVVLAQPATVTIASPPDATGRGGGGGKLNVVTYRGGRVDSTAECVPCAYDYSARRRRVDVRVWQLSGIGYTPRKR